jgi:dienelactone hydrolase
MSFLGLFEQSIKVKLMMNYQFLPIPRILWILILMTTSIFTSQLVWAQKDCIENPPNVANLVETRPGFHRVIGPLAKFNPCHSSVELSLPGFFSDKLAEKPPLMIIAHGGNGPGSAEKEMVRRMNSKGVATLLYDAYNMNGFEYRGTNLFLTGTSNESRQRMILKATVGAYRWAKTLSQVDTSRIFIHGLSNGGSVALNMAALVEPEHVRAVFAEGATPTGIGMPDKIKVPLFMVFGKIDNYGGKREDDWMYTRTDPCAFNQISPLAAIGTAHRCNSKTNPDKMTISPQAWADELKAAGQPIEFWFYENAAHGLLAGHIDRGMRTYGTGPSASVRYGWIGASPDAANQFVTDLMKVIAGSYR